MRPPAVLDAESDQDAAGRSSPPSSPRSGSTPRRARGRGSPAVLRPLARPSRDLCSRLGTEPTRDEPGPIPSPFPGESTSRPPPLTTRTPAYFLSPVAATIRSDAGPIPPTSGRLWFCEDAGSRSPHQCAGAPTTPPTGASARASRRNFPKPWAATAVYTRTLPPQARPLIHSSTHPLTHSHFPPIAASHSHSHKRGRSHPIVTVRTLTHPPTQRRGPHLPTRPPFPP